jgi:hypothetical protein
MAAHQQVIAAPKNLTSAYTLKASDWGKVFSNTGAGASVLITVPGGLPTGFYFWVYQNNGAYAIGAHFAGTDEYIQSDQGYTPTATTQYTNALGADTMFLKIEPNSSDKVAWINVGPNGMAAPS